MKHIVGFSGGVDSQACLRFVREKFGDEDVIAINSDVGGHEHPITTEFIAWYSKNIFPVVTVTPLVKDLGNRCTREATAGKQRRDKYDDNDPLTFPRLAEIRGLWPRRRMQFCTEHLKLSPMRRWQEENLLSKGVAFERYAGVRCDESTRRKDTPESTWDEFFHCIVNYPIRCWTKLECFAFLKARGEKTNPLYEMGFGRIGCAPCVNSGKDDVRQWAARFPEMIDKVRRWESETKMPFFAPCVPGKEINWIDEVVEWSKTTFGGKQFALPIVEAEAEAGTCSSLYGLCE